MNSWKQALSASPGPVSPGDYAVLYAKAFAMGTADLVPGVSGGTVAFVTGIYDRLLDALASVRPGVLKDLVGGRFKDAAAAVHVRFLATVALGIGSAVFCLSHLMHYLIHEHPVATRAAFFGLVAASIAAIFRRLDPKAPTTWGLLLAGALPAHLIVSLVPVEMPEAPWFIFLCGAVGITAMLLPGISGSFILLVLGKYEFITAALKSPFSEASTGIIAVFALGMATGMAAFCRSLRYLMHRYREATTAFLTGILVGSIQKMWPWKSVLLSGEIGGKTKILREANVLPPALDGGFALAVTLVVLGFALVFFMERQSRHPGR